MNELHDNISFSCEYESDNKLSFLDVLVRRGDQCYETFHYRKKTDTRLYSTPYSFCDPKYNSNLVASMTDRIWRLNSTYAGAVEDVTSLHDVLCDNGYNRCFAERISAKAINKHFIHEPKPATIISEDPLRPLILPYFTGAFKIENVFHNLETVNGQFVNVVFQTNKVSQYFSNKSKTPLDLKANLVYEFVCSGCDARYVGETNRHLRTRVAEHGQPSRGSHVFLHSRMCSDCSVKPVVDDFKVIKAGFPTAYSRLFYEAFKIRSKNPKINVHNDFHKYVSIFK